MKLRELIRYFDREIPLSFQEDYDNSGLQVGDPDQEVNSALLALDVTEDVLEEAIKKGCDLIVSHHPLIFKPLKRLTGKTATERIISKAILNGIAIYALHTNLDGLFVLRGRKALVEGCEGIGTARWKVTQDGDIRADITLRKGEQSCF